MTHLDENGFLHIHVIGNGDQEKEDENKILNHVTHECGSFHIESEWNKCMSDKISYQDLTEFIDTVYKSGVLQVKLPEANIKSIKLIIDQFSEFMNRKCKLNVQNGLYTQEEANRLISNYNSIYNEVIKIYGIGKIQNLNNNSIVRPTEIMDLGRREIEKKPGIISRGVEKVKAIFSKVHHKNKDGRDRN